VRSAEDADIRREWLAYFKDTEGHIFGAMQAGAAAKFNGQA
jgi:hypothetical protein